MSDSPYSVTTKLTRGSGTDDRDTIKASVEAESPEQLDDRIEVLQERLEEWAADLREIQPDQQRQLADDQSNLSSVDA